MASCLLVSVYSHPLIALDLDLPQWSLLVSQARRANVLARLHFLFSSADIFEQIPDKPRQLIQSAIMHANRFEISLNQELSHIRHALCNVDAPLLLLKGSAYYVAGNLAAKGRFFSDIDILVPENKLLEVEGALMREGWITNTFDPYDQHYYRQWMHELPPMRNVHRQTTIDVHHNILPKTTKRCPDAGLLLADIVQAHDTDFWVLSPEDRVLHSAVHLFYGGEWDNGFRDLSDLDLLLREFSVEPHFWTKLASRAVALKQETPLFYLLRYTAKMLKTPIPEAVLEASQVYAPTKIMLFALDGLFMKALLPNHPSCNDAWRQFACFVLYLRSHWLRMPIHLLLPHLARKAWPHLFQR